MQGLLGPSHCPGWRGSPGTPGGWPTAPGQSREPASPGPPPSLASSQPAPQRPHPGSPPTAVSDSAPRPLADLPCRLGLHPASGSRAGGEPCRAGRALIPWASSRQPGRDTWVQHQPGARKGTGSLGATRTAASLCLSPEMFTHPQGPRIPAWASPRPWHHPSLHLAAKAPQAESLWSAMAYTSGGTAPWSRPGGSRVGGCGAQEPASFPLIQNPGSTARSTQSWRSNRDGTGRNWVPLDVH